MKLLLEPLQLILGNLVHLGVTMHQPVNQGVRGLDPVGLDDLGNQLLPQLRVGLARRLALEILADGGPQRVQALEIPDSRARASSSGGSSCRLTSCSVIRTRRV